MDLWLSVDLVSNEALVSSPHKKKKQKNTREHALHIEKGGN
jgi:hypothetical protein